MELPRKEYIKKLIKKTAFSPVVPVEIHLALVDHVTREQAEIQIGRTVLLLEVRKKLNYVPHSIRHIDVPVTEPCKAE